MRKLMMIMAVAAAAAAGQPTIAAAGYSGYCEELRLACEHKDSLGETGLFMSEACPDQSRKRIWSVQKRSRRASDWLSAVNSSVEMPPICSTVEMCFS